jgi:hypothetical protein
MIGSGAGAGGAAGSTLGDAVNSMRSVAGLSSPEEENESCFPGLTYQQRLTGVVVCFGSGCLISILSSLFLWTGNIRGFAIFYTFGNLCAICSTLFLMGPKRQCAAMWKQHRAGATVIYFLAMVCTLVIAFVASHPAPACLVLTLIQFCAGCWYALSYIPYARQMVLTCCKDQAGVSV